jgi:hypothetical protein
MDSGHCALPFGTATGAFFICTHHDASLAYLAGLEPIFASGTAHIVRNLVKTLGAY